MRRIAPVLALTLSLALSAPALAGSGTASFSASYAVEGNSFGGGSVIYTSGTPNFLRATASGWVVQTMPMLVPVSIRQGWITSSRVRYTGPTGGAITWSTKGSFARKLNGGISIANGAIFHHVIRLQLVDVTQGKVLATYTHVDETIRCGGLVYPVGIGGCDSVAEETFGSPVIRRTTGSTVRYGDYLRIRVLVYSWIEAMGIVYGLEARTRASSLSGTISW